MVIAHVLSSFHVGGQEMLAVELASRQVERGHRVFAVSLAQRTPGTLEAAFVRAGVTPLHLPKLGPRFDPTLTIRLALAFRRHAVEVAHLHNPLPFVYGVPAGRMTGCAVVFTRHGLVEGSGRQLWLRRRIARLVDSYVAVSRQVADNTRSHRLASEPKLTVIENGIDLDQYQPRPDLREAVRAELGLSGDSQAIGCVCRLAECKNVGLLLQTVMPHLSPTRQVFIVGDGPERAALESLVNRHSTGSFARFLGQRDDVARLLNGFDLFALSSRTEGHPLAVIEAMATGLPVLATKVGGIPEMIEDDESGFLAEPDEASFAQRLATALDRWRSWPAMGQAARTSAGKRFSSRTMTERYLTLYQTLRLMRQRPDRGSPDR